MPYLRGRSRALLEDVAQTLRVCLFLPWASWAAGLHISAHTCRGVAFPAAAPAVRAACVDLPPDVTDTDDGGCEVTGLVPALARDLLATRLPCTTARTASLFQRPCRCALKTALVPSGHLDDWRQVMAFTPFGAEAVATSWPYLGATCCSRSRGDPPNDGIMEPPLLDDLRQGTWGKAFRKLAPRTVALHASHASAGRRAAIWNCHMASLVP